MRTVPAVTPRFAPSRADVPWPALSWPTGPATPDVVAVVDRAFSDPALATTNAVVVIQRGQLVAERYDGHKVHFDRPPEAIDATTPLISWSMAKSMLHCVIGMLVDAGRLDPDAPAPVPEWRSPGDPRGAIRLRDLLAMRSGLAFREEYVDGEASDVIAMLFGEGRSDVAGYAARQELQSAPGTTYAYSSGTTNILSRVVADQVGYGDAYRAFLADALFRPLGMTSATPTLDDAGVFVASSFVHATARDFARFGLLYLRGGLVGDRRLLSEAWAGTAQVPLSDDEETETFHAMHWWVVGDAFGTYAANGYDGQMIVVAPELDAVFVRLGRTPSEHTRDLRRWRADLLDALAA